MNLSWTCTYIIWNLELCILKWYAPVTYVKQVGFVIFKINQDDYSNESLIYLWFTENIHD